MLVALVARIRQRATPIFCLAMFLAASMWIAATYEFGPTWLRTFAFWLFMASALLRRLVRETTQISIQAPYRSGESADPVVQVSTVALSLVQRTTIV